MNHILLIEDDPAVAKGLEALLKSENYDVEESNDGKQGLIKALVSLPDLILLDLNLPSLNGFDVCRKLRENKFPNPVIMLTSYSDQVDKVVGLEIGADDYITKPFDNREVLARIRVQLRKPHRFENLNESETSSEDKYKRKLLSVMFTDIQDYSKTMNKDELLALKILKNHNCIMTECIKSGRGKVIEIIGDAFMVSFDSAVEAVICGANIQKRFKDSNKSKPINEKIKVRMGIHLGDVLEFEGKLKGDVINIAARIQQCAEAGNIFFSESVNAAIKNKTNFNPKSLGKFSLKNIREQMELYYIKI